MPDIGISNYTHVINVDVQSVFPYLFTLCVIYELATFPKSHLSWLFIVYCFSTMCLQVVKS